MTRSRSHARRRTRATVRRRPGAGPLVAFLLVASFGILFAGCKGPNTDDTFVDDTFTADDVARFRELSDDEEGMQSSAATVTSSLPRMDIATSSGALASVAPAVALDPVLSRQYDAIRAMSRGEKFYRVTNAFLNIRAAANTTSASVGRLEQGQTVEVLEFVNASWAKVKLADGTEGFASSRYIAKPVPESALVAEEKAFEKLYFVNFGFVNVRSEPNVSSAKLGEIPGQAFVQPLSIEGDWAKVAFEGKDGFISMQFLAPFKPTFLVRQDSFTLPVLRYDLSDPTMLTTLAAHAKRLRADGVKLMTLRGFFDLLLVQEVRDVRLQPKSAVIAVSGVTPQNVNQVSEALAGIPATLFLETQHVGAAGISERALLTLQANGFDIQSGGHTGDDLRSLTNAQLTLELQQSRALLEEMTNKTVFAVAYPQGGANDRVQQAAGNAGYLMGLSSAPDTTFRRDQLLRLPTLMITASMSEDDISQSIR